MAKFKLNFKKVPKFVGDALLIILSVLFALLVNEWRGNINQNNETEVILENIELELEANLLAVKGALEFHRKIQNNIGLSYEKDALEKTFFSEDEFSYMKVAPNGIWQARISDIAWEVARQENIASRIDFNTSKALFRVYDQQRAVLETIDDLISMLDQRETQKIENIDETITLMSGYLYNAIGQEGDWIIYLERAIEQLRSQE